MALENFEGFYVKAEELTFILILSMPERTKGNWTVIVVLAWRCSVTQRMVFIFKVIVTK